jgi:hypothetical protein
MLRLIRPSTFDLQSALVSLVDTAATLCGAVQGFIFCRVGELCHLAADFQGSPSL